MEVLKWLGCCLIFPTMLLFLGWPAIFHFLGYSSFTVWSITIGWFSVLIGTSIYAFDKFEGNL